ncbi:hypothetical protein CEE37_06780 [candidate division LCP-89 bacterium B3_LCP]|uniref:Secretion system C-terminal sorting domain-containing protein n=1 Tax=candidate division LCP-89 bacterium B3_LCP TaxID=2012998 RepID=A0A532V0J7_UNCL8|nr:MAG: hypothetical protein CEE37_06780 [candidate division LCP-89 bacterium B3_LCP]
MRRPYQTMEKDMRFALILLIPTLLLAQEFEFQQEYNTIPVEIDGWQPFCPWAGGFSESSPDFCDIDLDDDLDIFVGDLLGYVAYMKNTGSAIEPSFELVSMQYDSLRCLTFLGKSNIEFWDMDDDSDLDAIIGGGYVAYSKNTGTPENPNFVSSPDTLFNTVGYFVIGTHVALIDIDLDGDADMINGYSGYLLFYRNLGSADSAAFYLEETGWLGIDVGDMADPTFSDIDDDNDLDLFIGNEDGYIWFYLNEGDSINYNFTYITNNFEGIDVDWNASPEFADIDGDGDYDLFVGREQQSGSVDPGDIFFYKNTGTPTTPQWSFITRNYLTFDEGYRAQLHTTDIDADLDNDLFVSNFGNYISFYENTGSSSSAAFEWRTYTYQNISVSGGTIFFQDIDNDQDPDLFIGETILPNPPYPGLFLFINRGTPQSASYNLYSNNLVPGTYHVSIAPSLADIDADGDQDLFLSDNDGYFYYVPNIGTPSEPVFGDTTRDWQGISTEASTTSCFFDIDDDGDLDLFFTPWDDWNQVWFFRNIGDYQSPIMALETQTFLNFESLTVLDGIDIVDLDLDGDGDFLISSTNGGIFFFRNVTGQNEVGPKRPDTPFPKLDFSIGPNPANPVTWISFTLPSPQEATLAVYNILGAKVTTLTSGIQPPGTHNYLWNAAEYSSGVYIIRLETPQQSSSQRITVLK